MQLAVCLSATSIITATNELQSAHTNFAQYCIGILLLLCVCYCIKIGTIFWIGKVGACTWRKVKKTIEEEAEEIMAPCKVIFTLIEQHGVYAMVRQSSTSLMAPGN